MSDQTPKPGLGPIGTKVLFENESIRVWSIELPPKGHQPLHEHHHPYLIVPITRGKSVMKWPDGRERELIDVPGDVKYREPTADRMNCSTWRTTTSTASWSRSNRPASPARACTSHRIC
jgi:hypothetical protein